jgi:hypothetical protein
LILLTESVKRFGVCEPGVARPLASGAGTSDASYEFYKDEEYRNLALKKVSLSSTRKLPEYGNLLVIPRQQDYLVNYPL